MEGSRKLLNQYVESSAINHEATIQYMYNNFVVDEINADFPSMSSKPIIFTKSNLRIRNFFPWDGEITFEKSDGSAFTPSNTSEDTYKLAFQDLSNGVDGNRFFAYDTVLSEVDWRMVIQINWYELTGSTINEAILNFQMGFVNLLHFTQDSDKPKLLIWNYDLSQWDDLIAFTSANGYDGTSGNFPTETPFTFFYQNATLDIKQDITTEITGDYVSYGGFNTSNYRKGTIKLAIMVGDTTNKHSHYLSAFLDYAELKLTFDINQTWDIGTTEISSNTSTVITCKDSGTTPTDYNSLNEYPASEGFTVGDSFVVGEYSENILSTAFSNSSDFTLDFGPDSVAAGVTETVDLTDVTIYDLLQIICNKMNAAWWFDPSTTNIVVRDTYTSTAIILDETDLVTSLFNFEIDAENLRDELKVQGSFDMVSNQTIELRDDFTLGNEKELISRSLTSKQNLLKYAQLFAFLFANPQMNMSVTLDFENPPQSYAAIAIGKSIQLQLPDSTNPIFFNQTNNNPLLIRGFQISQNHDYDLVTLDLQRRLDLTTRGAFLEAKEIYDFANYDASDFTVVSGNENISFSVNYNDEDIVCLDVTESTGGTDARGTLVIKFNTVPSFSFDTQYYFVLQVKYVTDGVNFQASNPLDVVGYGGAVAKVYFKDPYATEYPNAGIIGGTISAVHKLWGYGAPQDVNRDDLTTSQYISQSVTPIVSSSTPSDVTNWYYPLMGFLLVGSIELFRGGLALNTARSIINTSYLDTIGGIKLPATKQSKVIGSPVIAPTELGIVFDLTNEGSKVAKMRLGKLWVVVDDGLAS
jgi:hypothetical protein